MEKEWRCLLVSPVWKRKDQKELSSLNGWVVCVKLTMKKQCLENIKSVNDWHPVFENEAFQPLLSFEKPKANGNWALSPR